MNEEFFVKTHSIDNGPNRWDYMMVSIYRRTPEGETKIGEYLRNYSALFDTFHPFQKDGKWYALYSKDYTATRVMELPSCRDLGGEEPDTNGFCPVDYYVPYQDKTIAAAGKSGQFGFVSGCIWGDDNSWKIQYLDLSEIESGSLARKEMFGYVSMPESAKRLQDCISFLDYDHPDDPIVTLTVDISFNLETGARYPHGDC